MTDMLFDRPFNNRMGIRAPTHITVRDVLRDVCDRHCMTIAEILSPRRHPWIVAVRHEAMWECRRLTKASLPQIAEALGLANHATVLHGIRKHEERMRGTA